MDWKAPSCDLCNGPVKASYFPTDSEVKKEKKASAGKSRIKLANILSYEDFLSVKLNWFLLDLICFISESVQVKTWPFIRKIEKLMIYRYLFFLMNEGL